MEIGYFMYNFKFVERKHLSIMFWKRHIYIDLDQQNKLKQMSVERKKNKFQQTYVTVPKYYRK